MSPLTRGMVYAVAVSQYSGAELKKALRRDIDDLARTKALQVQSMDLPPAVFMACFCTGSACCAGPVELTNQAAMSAFALPWLQGYEIPRDFIVDMEPFSKANHLITDSGKPARGKLKAK